MRAMRLLAALLLVAPAATLASDNAFSPEQLVHLEEFEHHLKHGQGRAQHKLALRQATRVRNLQVTDSRAAAAAWTDKRKRQLDDDGHEELAKRSQPSQSPGCVSGASPVGAYGQCGGKNYVGSCTCITGWECIYSNDYYSQCQPAEAACKNSFWSQCGGAYFDGSGCCPDGSACVYSNKYYSQCIPGAETTATSDGKKSASSESSSSTPTSTSTSSTSSSSSSSSSTTSSKEAEPTSTTCSNDAYGQCGGADWGGSECCPAGYACEYSNAYYSQCKPVASDNTCSNSFYGQCGGKDWSGSTCCPSFSACVYQDDYYSQCVPGATSSDGSQKTKTSSYSSASPTKTKSDDDDDDHKSSGRSSLTSGSKPTSTKTEDGDDHSRTTTSKSQDSSYKSPTPTSTSTSKATSSTKQGDEDQSKASSTSSSESSSPTCASSRKWAQCAGLGYNGSTCCPGGYECVRSNAYYSQCQPSGNASSSSSSNSSSSSSKTSGKDDDDDKRTSSSQKASSTSSSAASSSSSSSCSSSRAYGQCGGKSYYGSTCCPSGYSCDYDNDWYSQCRPGDKTDDDDDKKASSSSSKSSSSSSSSSSEEKKMSSTLSSTKQSSSSSASSSSSTSSSCSASRAYAQCGGHSYYGSTCCPSGYFCDMDNTWYSQCRPGDAEKNKKTSSDTPSTTTSSAAPKATCKAGSSGSDGCTPYTVTGNAITLPSGETFSMNGHVNYQAISCSDYKPGQSYLNPGSNWSPQAFGVHFEPKKSSDGYAYIGASTFDFGGASAAFGGSYCVTWIQIDSYNQHFGEGGQAPICSSQCGK